MPNQELTSNVQKVPLSTRIPESIDLRIEQVVQSHGIKKQELIAQVLELGLSKIHELGKANNTDTSSKTKKDEEGTLEDSENFKVLTQGFSISKTVEDLLYVSNDIKSCLLSIKKLSEENVKYLSNLKEIFETICFKEPNKSATNFSAGWREKGNSTEVMSLPDLALEEIIKTRFSELQQALSTENLNILDKLKFFEQELKRLQNKPERMILDNSLNTSLESGKTINKNLEENVPQESNLKINEQNMHLQNQIKIETLVFKDQETLESILVINGQSYFTLTEIYKFAQLAGYLKHYSTFRDLFLKSKYSQQHQLEWGVKLDKSLYSALKGCRYIQLLENGKLAKTILASPGILRDLRFIAD